MRIKVLYAGTERTEYVTVDEASVQEATAFMDANKAVHWISVTDEQGWPFRLNLDQCSKVGRAAS